MTKSANQRGMALIEMLVVVAIAGMFSGLLGTSAYQIMKTTGRGNDELRAAQDVRNAGHWLSLDGRRAQTIDLVDGAPPVNTATLSWTDGDEVTHTSTYSLWGTELQRDYDGTVMVMARHISSVEFSLSQGLLTASVISSPGADTSNEAIYNVCLRSVN